MLGDHADFSTVDAGELADLGEAVTFTVLQRRAQLRGGVSAG